MGLIKNSNDYVDEGKHSKIVLNKHFIEKIKYYHPLSIDYIPYWKSIKRRCMEGMWAEGKWMPGNLFMYINLCRIRLNKDRFSTTKIIGKPLLRDLEWEKAYVFAEARGFSGFQDDPDETCYLEASYVKATPEEIAMYIALAPPQALKDGKFKKYVPPREYLRRIHTTNLGKPLYQNNAWNVIDMEARGSGKSYWGANGMILNTWLTDGLYDYDVYEEQLAAGELASVEVLVGAIEGKFTKDLLDKVLVSMDDFVGNQIINGTLHPSPIMKRSSGSWYSGKQYIENKFEVKVGGSWQTRGSGSKIYNRAFMDNPFAGNGTRPSVTVIEEVGFFNILDEALGALKDVTYNSADKFGTIYMFGTGGENDAMAVAKVKEVFTDPASYDCLSFDDTWENTGSIGFFIPFELTLNNFKDEEGITDMQQATSFADGKRLKLSKGKSKTPLYSEMMNNPRVPSEIFLAKDANIFPTAELKDHLNYLKAHQTDPVIKGQNGMFGIKMINADTARVEWEPDLTNSLTPCHYPMKKTDATEGCWVIWEHPVYVDGEIPHGLYIAGNDPYDQDKAPNSVSLGSTFIYKTMMIGDSDQLTNFIVAEYTARPATAKEHHEQVRRGLLYYNARCLYENERNTLQMHFDHKNSLYLLTKTPTILKATATSNVQRSAGTHMTESIKDEIEIYTRDELLESIGDERLALHKINSIPLIEELIAYNRRGNFDRVIAFMLVVLNKLNNHKLKVESISTSKTTDPFFDRFNKGMFYK